MHHATLTSLVLFMASCTHSYNPKFKVGSCIVKKGLETDYYAYQEVISIHGAFYYLCHPSMIARYPSRYPIDYIDEHYINAEDACDRIAKH